MNDFFLSLLPILLTTLYIMIPVTIIYFGYKWMKAYLELKRQQTELLKEILSELKEMKK